MLLNIALLLGALLSKIAQFLIFSFSLFFQFEKQPMAQVMVYHIFLFIYFIRFLVRNLIKPGPP